MAKRKSLNLDVEKFRVFLCFGHDYLNDLAGHEPTPAEVRLAWSILGPEIMAGFASEPKRRAGSRPYGWWLCQQGYAYKPDAGEQRDFLEEHGLLTAEEQAVLAERDEKYKNVPYPADWKQREGIRDGGRHMNGHAQENEP
jgi:hypothetical protein